jgi:putative ABC transport system ATP-binding protein
MTTPHPTTGAPAPAARVEALVKIYGSGPAAVRALDGVDVSFATGRFTAIMGPSGSGKSTLLHCVAGLETVTSGRVWIDGTELGPLRDDDLTRLRRDRIGFVFQAFNLLPMLTAEQNMRLPMSLAGRKPDPDWFAYVVEVLGLGDRLGHRPAELSGGQQQRVAIGRAMVSRPAIIVADEPTGNLDSRSGGEVLGALRSWARDAGQTVVMVTHDAVAASYADEVVLLADGRVRGVVVDPTPARVMESLAMLVPVTAGAVSR